jgi:hypothetical protein
MEIAGRLVDIAVKLCDRCMITLIDFGIPEVLRENSGMAVTDQTSKGCESLLANGRSRCMFPIRLSAL